VFSLTRVVIIGGGAAGMAAASRAKRLNPKLDVVVIERTKWVSFALCGIPYYTGCVVKTLDQLLYYKPEEFTEKRGIPGNCKKFPFA
jgi:NADPH-dependent 2,4-dienoyl-CoA reductase/sulfur reductase-like enzyme